MGLNAAVAFTPGSHQRKGAFGLMIAAHAIEATAIAHSPMFGGRSSRIGGRLGRPFTPAKFSSN